MGNRSFGYKLATLAAGLCLGAIAANASAQIPYPNSGTQNTQDLTYVAANTGNLNVWFDGSHAGDDNKLVAIVNGAQIGSFTMDDHTSTLGEYFNLGPVNAGDSIVLEMENLTTGDDFYTTNSLNPDGANHAYTALFSGGLINGVYVPASRYFGFEDLTAAQGTDWNYQDETFFIKSGFVPEPATWAMMLLGVGMVGGGLRMARRKDEMALTAA
jgi:PEP-CTERM motif